MKNKNLLFYLKLLAVLLPLLAIVLQSNVSGIFFILYFFYLFILLFLQNELVHRIRFHKINLSFEFEVLLAIIAVIACVAVLDFSVVETFKRVPNFPNDSTYWRNLFNVFLPVLWGVLGFVYHLGGGSIGNAIKIVIVGVFLEYSTINDFLYYLLNATPLPDKWTWLATPQFLFGSTITTPQLTLWLLLMLALAIVVLLLPLDNFFKANSIVKEERYPVA